ncbi:MAG: hypothetical protein ACI9Z9_001966, partial [Litorivivens sp.]
YEQYWVTFTVHFIVEANIITNKECHYRIPELGFVMQFRAYHARDVGGSQADWWTGGCASLQTALRSRKSQSN